MRQPTSLLLEIPLYVSIINERGECVVATEIPCDHSKQKCSLQNGDVQECDES